MSIVNNKLTKLLSVYKKDMLVKLKKVVIDTAVNLEDSAVRDAPLFITIDKIAVEGMKGYEVDVAVKADPEEASALAAYFEFGTGLSARQILAPYPDYVKKLAWTFKGDVDGTLKGIPYFYPNYFRLEPIFMAKLQKLLKDGH